MYQYCIEMNTKRKKKKKKNEVYLFDLLVLSFRLDREL